MESPNTSTLPLGWLSSFFGGGARLKIDRALDRARRGVRI